MVRRSLTVLIASLTLSCGSDAADDSPIAPSDGEATYDVTYAPETVVIDEAAMSGVTVVDPELQTYSIDAAAAGAVELAPGRILLLHGTALRRIASATTEGNRTLVTTEHAALEEAMTEADIAWSQTIDFAPERADQLGVTLDGRALKPQVVGGDGKVEFKTKIGEYDYTITLTLMGNRTDVVIQIEKEVGGGVKGRFTATGTVNQFVVENRIRIEGGKLREFGHAERGMKGDMTLNLTVAGSGNDALDFKVPVVLIKYPMLVGPIPVVAGISAQIVLNGVVPVEGSSQVEAKFGFDSTLGLSFDGAKVSASGNVGLPTIAKGAVTQTGAAGAIGANFGVGFPRMSLEIFGELAVAWIQPAFLVGGSFTFTPPCQTADAQFIAAAGYDLAILTVTVASANQTLYQRKEPLLRSGNCPAE